MWWGAEVPEKSFFFFLRSQTFVFKCNLHAIKHIDFKYTVWLILTFVYTHRTTVPIKVWNSSITLLCPPSCYLFSVCTICSTAHWQKQGCQGPHTSGGPCFAVPSSNISKSSSNALDQAAWQCHLGRVPPGHPWSCWVSTLRAVLLHWFWVTQVHTGQVRGSGMLIQPIANPRAWVICGGCGSALLCLCCFHGAASSL